MAIERIIELPVENNPVAGAAVPIDGATTRQTTIQKLVDAGAPVASQAEAEAGVQATKRMTPLTTKQAVDVRIGVDLQEFSVNLDEVATVNPGAAGLAILADAQTDDVRSYLTVIPRVEDNAAIAALDSTKDTMAELLGAIYDSVEGDFTDAAGFDLNEHIIVPDGTRPITEAAWVRRLTRDIPDLRMDFKAKGDSRICGAGTILGGSLNTVSVSTSQFTSEDVGKIITVQGAGPDIDPGAGVEYTLHRSTIVSINSSTSVNMLDAATTAVAGASTNQVWVGSDDWQAAQDWIHWMEEIPLRQRVASASRGDFMIKQPIVIPIEITGITIVGADYWNTNFRGAITGSDLEMFANQSQEFKVKDMTFASTAENADNVFAGRVGIRNDKGIGQTADVDMIVEGGCRFQGWAFGVYTKGRSCMVRPGNHFASCDWAVGFDWYDTADYTADDEHSTDLNGFRGNIVQGIRVHSPFSGAIWNDGDNAHKASGLKVIGVDLDIGRTIFQGHLGLNGAVIGCSSLQTPTPALILTGGTGFMVADIVAGGTGKITGAPVDGDYTPTNLIQLTSGDDAGVTTGIFSAGRFANVALSYCEEHAVRDSAYRLDGVSFDNFTFKDVGFNVPASWRCFSFGSGATVGGDITVNNATFVGSDTLNAIVGNNQANNKIRVNDPRPVGNPTPYITGSNITVNRRRTYAPTLTNTTNVATSSMPSIDYIDLDDDYMMLTGRATVTATTASSACVLRISLPQSFDITDASQVSGVWACSSPGAPSSVGGIFGEVTNNVMEVRWTPSVNTSMSYQIDVKLRRS